MIDLRTLPDDVIVAEMQARLDAGTVGWHGLLSTQQANHRDNWHALLETIRHYVNEHPREFGPRMILQRAYELQDVTGPQVGIYAINTTFMGKETAFQDHAPKMEHAA